MDSMRVVKFDGVGRFSALTQHGVTYIVQVGGVVRLWAGHSAPDVDAEHGETVPTSTDLDDPRRNCKRTVRLFNTLAILEKGKRDTRAQSWTWREARIASQEQEAVFRDTFERTSPRHRAMDPVECQTWYVTSQMSLR